FRVQAEDERSRHRAARRIADVARARGAVFAAFEHELAEGDGSAHGERRKNDEVEPAADAGHRSERGVRASRALRGYERRRERAEAEHELEVRIEHAFFVEVDAPGRAAGDERSVERARASDAARARVRKGAAEREVRHDAVERHDAAAERGPE